MVQISKSRSNKRYPRRPLKVSFARKLFGNHFENCKNESILKHYSRKRPKLGQTGRYSIESGRCQSVRCWVKSAEVRTKVADLWAKATDVTSATLLAQSGRCRCKAADVPQVENGRCWPFRIFDSKPYESEFYHVMASALFQFGKFPVRSWKLWFGDIARTIHTRFSFRVHHVLQFYIFSIETRQGIKVLRGQLRS